MAGFVAAPRVPAVIVETAQRYKPWIDEAATRMPVVPADHWWRWLLLGRLYSGTGEWWWATRSFRFCFARSGPSRKDRWYAMALPEQEHYEGDRALLERCRPSWPTSFGSRAEALAAVRLAVESEAASGSARPSRLADALGLGAPT